MQHRSGHSALACLRAQRTPSTRGTSGGAYRRPCGLQLPHSARHARRHV